MELLRIIYVFMMLVTEIIKSILGAGVMTGFLYVLVELFKEQKKAGDHSC